MCACLCVQILQLCKDVRLCYNIYTQPFLSVGKQLPDVYTLKRQADAALRDVTNKFTQATVPAARSYHSQLPSLRQRLQACDMAITVIEQAVESKLVSSQAYCDAVTLAAVMVGLLRLLHAWFVAGTWQETESDILGPCTAAADGILRVLHEVFYELLGVHTHCVTVKQPLTRERLQQLAEKLVAMLTPLGIPDAQLLRLGVEAS